jgi:hypothetical protein
MDEGKELGEDKDDPKILIISSCQGKVNFSVFAVLGCKLTYTLSHSTSPLL